MTMDEVLHADGDLIYARSGNDLIRRAAGIDSVRYETALDVWAVLALE